MKEECDQFGNKRLGGLIDTTLNCNKLHQRQSINEVQNKSRA